MREHLKQYLAAAERVVTMLRLQHARVEDETSTVRSYDAELYAIVLANYGSLLYRGAGRRTDEPVPVDPGFVALSHSFDRRFPRLRNFRNYHGHLPMPKFAADEVSWHLFWDGPMAELADGRIEYIVDADWEHPFVENLHRQVVSMLETAIATEIESD